MHSWLNEIRIIHYFALYIFSLCTPFSQRMPETVATVVASQYRMRFSRLAYGKYFAVNVIVLFCIYSIFLRHNNLPT